MTTFKIPKEHNAMCVQMEAFTTPIFEIKDVKLEIGNVATEYQPKTYGEEFRACQRYYRETPFMVSGSRGRDVVSYGHVNMLMRVEPKTSVKSLTTGVEGKVDLIKGYGSGNPTEPMIVMSNAGVSRVILILPTGYNGMQGTLIEDAEIY